MTLPPFTHPFPWDYDRAETMADAVVHVLGIALAIAGAEAGTSRPHTRP